MYRRKVLAGTALLVTAPMAGCIGGDDDGDLGDDDDPFEVDPASLLLTPDTLETVQDGDFEEWTTEDVDEFSPAFREADVVRELWDDEDQGMFDDSPFKSGVWLFDTVDDAREKYEELVDPWVIGHGLEEEEAIGVEGHAGTVTTMDGLQDIHRGYAAFRDANAIGVVTHHSDASELDREQATIDVAQAKHISWRE